MTEQIVTDYELSCMTDPVLLSLHTATLAIPSHERTPADLLLLDDIGRHWQVRKNGRNYGIRACFQQSANDALSARLHS